MNAAEIHHYLSIQHRNIYQEAELFTQNRKKVAEYKDVLCHPFKNELGLELEGSTLKASNGDIFNVEDDVIDFRIISTKEDKVNIHWSELNKTLVNYQRYLTPYVLLNSLPIYNYIGEKTGLNKIKDALVIDVGAGTGQIFGTFFYHQESINYFLVDPNLRLLHDQFLRLYPKIATFPLSHLLSYAENLPFKSGVADLVLSLSSIDHFKDYKQFMREAHRVLKNGGQILIASHLDTVSRETKKVNEPNELKTIVIKNSLMKKVYNRLNLKFEELSRKFHNKKRGNIEDDHMHHFDGTELLEKSLKECGFEVELAEVFKHNFFIKAKKVSNFEL
ncbi:MAG: class I SAM-dependent methyltransferase [bacterium]|nr:class I SAM-dependent methyltransferase [bacterium]